MEIPRLLFRSFNDSFSIPSSYRAAHQESIGAGVENDRKMRGLKVEGQAGEGGRSGSPGRPFRACGALQTSAFILKSVQAGGVQMCVSNPDVESGNAWTPGRFVRAREISRHAAAKELDIV